MIHRVFDAAFLNQVANHPEVRPWLGGEGEIDFQPALNDANNIGLVTDGGGWLIHKLGPGLYECHTQFLPDQRGRHVVAAMREGFRYMFTETDCMEVVSRIPDGNRGAEGLAQAAGFREIFRRERCWPKPGDEQGVSFRSLSFDEWRALDPELEQIGQALHEQFENAKLTWGVTSPGHPDDDAHNRAAGASVLMFQRNNPHKAVLTYNRWAAFAGYPPISMLSLNPLLIDLGGMLVTLSAAGGMEVLQCRSGQL